AGDVIEDPGYFRAGEIGIDDQAGLLRDQRLMTFGLELRANISGAAILPDDGAVHGLARAAIPHHGGVALVGAADPGDVLRFGAGFAKRVEGGSEGGSPYLLRLVLDPAGSGEMLRESLLRHRRNRNVAAKHDGARGCGALIDGQHERHCYDPWRFTLAFVPS